MSVPYEILAAHALEHRALRQAGMAGLGGRMNYPVQFKVRDQRQGIAIPSISQPFHYPMLRSGWAGLGATTLYNQGSSGVPGPYYAHGFNGLTDDPEFWTKFGLGALAGGAVVGIGVYFAMCKKRR